MNASQEVSVKKINFSNLEYLWKSVNQSSEYKLQIEHLFAKLTKNIASYSEFSSRCWIVSLQNYYRQGFMKDKMFDYSYFKIKGLTSFWYFLQK